MTHSIETDRQQRACKCEVNSQALLQTGVNRLGRKSGVMANWYLPPNVDGRLSARRKRPIPRPGVRKTWLRRAALTNEGGINSMRAQELHAKKKLMLRYWNIEDFWFNLASPAEAGPRTEAVVPGRRCSGSGGRGRFAPGSTARALAKLGEQPTHRAARRI